MKIIADENIPFVIEAFSGHGEVRALPGRAISARDVAEADVLLVRSVTPVNAHLVSNSTLSFVGSATAGIEHVDQGDLRNRGIAFASAPGSNAQSVAEWVVCALFELEAYSGQPLNTLTLGVVGVGQVGSRVVRVAKALGMQVLLNDPPRARREGTKQFVDLDALWREADIVSVHVPLNLDGRDRTLGLFSTDRFRDARHLTGFFNASRGGVVDETALVTALDQGSVGFAALDVWIGEPQIDRDVLARVNLATPHIAGYSADGKIRGTAMLHRALCEHLGVEPVWDGRILPEGHRLEVSEPVTVAGACRAVYDIGQDDRALRRISTMDRLEAATTFDQLRKHYPVRREFSRAGSIGSAGVDPRVLATLRALGFIVTEEKTCSDQSSPSQ